MVRFFLVERNGGRYEGPRIGVRRLNVSSQIAFGCEAFAANLARERQAIRFGQVSACHVGFEVRRQLVLLTAL